MATVSTAHPVVRPDWLELVQEEIIDPALPIIDPHHHLWHDRPVGPLHAGAARSPT